jgi:hypothetical protein
MRIQDFSNTAEFLATLSKDQLKEYAQNNAGNPYLVSLALFVSDQQKAMDRSKQAKAQPQGSVVDTAINNIAPMARATIPAEEVEFDMPEDSGIGQIPVDETYFGANGGIIAFADEGLVTDPQFGGSTGEIAEDRPKPTKEQVSATLQALRDSGRTVGLSDIFDAESGRLTAPTKSPVAAPKVTERPSEAVAGDRRVAAPVSTSAAPSTAPRGVATPSSQSLGIQGMFDEAMGKVAVTESPLQSQFENIARMKKELAQAETAGAEKIQEKFGDITKGQKSRLDAKEKEIAAMEAQSLGIGLLYFGAEMMLKRNPDAKVGIDAYMANRNKVVAARDKLSESRDRLEAAEAQRGELNATQLHKLRMNERKVGIEATEEIVKDIKERYNVSREMALKILDLQIKDAIALRGEARADRRTEMAIGAKEKPQQQQVFDQFLREAGGNAIQAQKAYNLAFGDKNNPNREYQEALLKKKAEIISGPLAGDKMGLAQLANIDAELAKMSVRQGSNPLPANPSAANLTVGTVYQTARGPAKWTGTGFSPV